MVVLFMRLENSVRNSPIVHRLDLKDTPADFVKEIDDFKMLQLFKSNLTLNKRFVPGPKSSRCDVTLL